MTCLATTTPCPVRLVTPATSFDQWRRNRLTEARGILADATRHPSSLVIIAARVVVGLTGDSAECAKAIDLARARDPRPLHAIANQHGERATTAVIGTERVKTRGKWRTIELLACPVT